MRYVTPSLVLLLFVFLGGSTLAAANPRLQDLTLEPTPPCITSHVLLSVATSDAATAPSRQQRSGDGTGESDSRSGACADAQADAASAADRACEGPFAVDSCRCERDERDPDDPDDDVWSCTAYWRCNSLSSVSRPHDR